MEKSQIIPILESLANGTNPFTGMKVQEDQILHHPEIVRTLFQTIELLKDKRRGIGLPGKNGSSWSEEEDAILTQEFGNRNPIAEIAKSHDRTVGAIRSRLKKLGLIKEGHQQKS